MPNIATTVSIIAKVIEFFGILIICAGLCWSTAKFTFGKGTASFRNYTILRQTIGKSILLGLEVLVAADIIGTVVTDPTLENVYTLGVIVLIRTFLSLSLQVELEGKFPWQGTPKTDAKLVQKT